MFQWQFWICNVFGQGVPHSRSGYTEASWPEATCPGSRCGEVSPCRRTKVGSRPDYRNGDAGSTEIYRATTMEWILNEGCNFEDDALANGKPMKLIPEHRRDVVKFPSVRDQPGRRIENAALRINLWLTDCDASIMLLVIIIIIIINTVFIRRQYVVYVGKSLD